MIYSESEPDSNFAINSASNFDSFSESNSESESESEFWFSVYVFFLNLYLHSSK